MNELSISMNSGWKLSGTAKWVLALLAAAPVLGVLIWQGVTSNGSPDPTTEKAGSMAGIVDIGVLVFREGLESILVLAAITAGLTRKNGKFAKPIFLGAGAGFLVTILTWFAFKGLMSDLTQVTSMLVLQAVTGMVAVVVLLIVMNWFLHKIYWGGWIVAHNKKKQEILDQSGQMSSSTYWSLVLLGMSSVYREGFEVVLFLQSYYLKLGELTVYQGAAVGAVLTGIVAVLTFWAHKKLPYRKMLIFTGIMLGAVLLVMVGEEAQEMQLASWLPTTKLAFLEPYMPDWTGVWFSLYPTVETIVAQALAAIIVGGSYFAARLVSGSPRKHEHESHAGAGRAVASY